MKRKTTRTNSSVDLYKEELERKGLLKMVGSKKFDEFLDEVYSTLGKEKKIIKEKKKKKKKSLSTGDVSRKEDIRKVETEDSKLKMNSFCNIDCEMEEDSFYSNGYLQSVAHRPSPLNKKEYLYRIDQQPSGTYYNNGYQQAVAHRPLPFDASHHTSRDHPRPMSCIPPPLVRKQPEEKRPHSCDPKGVFHSPRLERLKVNKKELTLRIQAALGLLKLKHHTFN
ncbi:hypothetical protein NGRA_1781 [Nosema granulosis]|uniref:Uncharacterized protein n=1 Tax=Nosema granulosis TaxID=83296 RepID=A0A9P6GXV2_9MICR|nr:hypothetical protein NGRA_1781 [Nosema granulosis]